jgi:hypothetical protein
LPRLSLAGLAEIRHHFPMLSLGVPELVAALFILASAVLMLHVPEAVSRMRDGVATRRDWLPVAAATVVLLSVAVFSR